MPDQDRIEIWQGERALRGVGSLRVTGGAPGQGSWPVMHVEGVVTFDEPVTSADLWAMDEAEVEIDLEGGAHHAFGFSVVMEQDADARMQNTHAPRLECFHVKT